MKQTYSIIPILARISYEEDAYYSMNVEKKILVLQVRQSGQKKIFVIMKKDKRKCSALKQLLTSCFSDKKN